MKRCWTLLPIREILQNHKMSLHTHKGGYNKKSQVTTNTGEEVGKKEPQTLWLGCKWCGHFIEKYSEELNSHRETGNSALVTVHATCPHKDLDTSVPEAQLITAKRWKQLRRPPADE